VGGFSATVKFQETASTGAPLGFGLSTWDTGDGIEVQHDERTGAFSGLSTILAGDKGMYLDPPQRVGRYTFG